MGPRALKLMEAINMDSDLSFLRKASNEDLDPLVGYILNAEISESLSDMITLE